MPSRFDRETRSRRPLSSDRAGCCSGPQGSRHPAVEVSRLSRSSRAYRSRRRGKSSSSYPRPMKNPAITGEHDADAGRHEPVVGAPRQRLADVGVLQHEPPTDDIRIAEAEEADRRLGQDRPADRQRAVEQRQRQDVRRDVEEDRAPRAGARDLCRLDEGRAAARSAPGSGSPARYRTRGEAPSPGRCSRCSAARKATRTITNGRNGIPKATSVIRIRVVVDPAAEVPGDQTDERADEDDEERRREADQQRGPGAVDQLREDVAPDVRGPERKVRGSAAGSSARSRRSPSPRADRAAPAAARRSATKMMARR